MSLDHKPEVSSEASPQTNPEAKSYQASAANSIPGSESTPLQAVQETTIENTGISRLSSRSKGLIAGITATAVVAAGSVLAWRNQSETNTSSGEPEPGAVPTQVATAAQTPGIPSPTPEVTPSSTPSSNSTETAKPSSDSLEFKLPNGEVFRLPTPQELGAMSPEKQLEAIRLPEAFLDDPEALYIAHHKAKEIIYNSVARDEVYIAYIESGGLDYPEYAMSRILPLLEQLSGDLDEVTIKGASDVAFTIANVQYMRIYNGFTDIFKPYSLTVTIVSVDKDSPSKTITGTISASSSFDQEQSDLLKEITNRIIKPTDETPFTADLTKIKFNDKLKTVQAVSIRV